MLVPHPLSAVQRVKSSLLYLWMNGDCFSPLNLLGSQVRLSETLGSVPICCALKIMLVFVLCFPKGLTPRPIRRSLITDPKSKADTMGIGSWALWMV